MWFSTNVPIFYFILFYFILFFKIKFGNKNDNFGEFLAQYSGFFIFLFFCFQFGDSQEGISQIWLQPTNFLKRILLYFSNLLEPLV